MSIDSAGVHNKFKSGVYIRRPSPQSKSMLSYHVGSRCKNLQVLRRQFGFSDSTPLTVHSRAIVLKHSIPNRFSVSDACWKSIAFYLPLDIRQQDLVPVRLQPILQ